MWKISTFLSHPILMGLGAVASIVALIVIFRKHIFNALSYVVVIIGNVIKIKASVGVLILVGLGGFAVATLIQNNGQVLEDLKRTTVELRKEKETLQNQLVMSRETIQQKDNEIDLINEEKKKLKEKLETRKKQIETYRDRIKQKDNEINKMKKHTSHLEAQLADSTSREKELRNKVSQLEKKRLELQVEISNLKKSAEIQPISFEYINNKLFLRDSDKEKELFIDYDIYGFSKSKSKKKIAIVSRRKRVRPVTWTIPRYYNIMVSNADRDLSDSSIWEIDGHDFFRPPKNLKWISDTVLRVYLIGESGSKLKLDHILLERTGTYEITIGEVNTLVKVERIEFGHSGTQD